MLVNCMLDSGATHSFVHSCIVQLMEVQPSQGDVLLATMANGSKLSHYNVCTLDLTFMAERGRLSGDSVMVTVCARWFVKQCDTWDGSSKSVQSINKLA